MPASFVVWANSTRVVLPLRTFIEGSEIKPVLTGLLLSLSKSNGLIKQVWLTPPKEKIERPFQGKKWCYEWRPDGQNLMALWVAFPDIFFQSSLNPHPWVLLEALGYFGKEEGELRCLSKIELSIRQAPDSFGDEKVAWLPLGFEKDYRNFV